MPARTSARRRPNHDYAQTIEQQLDARRVGGIVNERVNNRR
jgi:hypothetical protein